MFLYKLRGIKFRSSFNGKEKLCTLALKWYLLRWSKSAINLDGEQRLQTASYGSSLQHCCWYTGDHLQHGCVCSRLHERTEVMRVLGVGFVPNKCPQRNPTVAGSQHRLLPLGGPQTHEQHHGLGKTLELVSFWQR